MYMHYTDGFNVKIKVDFKGKIPVLKKLKECRENLSREVEKKINFFNSVITNSRSPTNDTTILHRTNCGNRAFGNISFYYLQLVKSVRGNAMAPTHVGFIASGCDGGFCDREGPTTGSRTLQ